MTDIDAEMQEICRNEGEACKTCMGNDCNLRKMFQRCVQCDSRVGNPKKCMERIWSGKEKVCKDYYGECYTHIENDVVRRGCIGDDVVPEAKDCSNPSKCEKCSGQRACNEYEVVQERCLTCDSANDKSCQTNATLSVPCPLMITPMGCYHSIDSKTKATKRGCIANLSEEENRKYDENKFENKKCLGENCNSKKSFGKCIFCDSYDDPNCATAPNSSNSKTCERYDDDCFSFIHKYGVIRGCLGDNTQDIISKCRSNLDKCEICESNGDFECNNSTVTPETCFECDSENGNCSNPADDFIETWCNVLNATSEGCYVQVVGDKAKTGCINDLTSDLKQNCQTQSDTCKTCTDKNCNKVPGFQKCFDCTSRIDENCTEVKNSTKTTICKEYFSTCVTGIDEKGYTHRRCTDKSINENIKSPNGFIECSQNECNGDVFPKDRLLCYQSDEDRDKLPESPSETLSELAVEACEVLSQYSQCYTYISEGTRVFKL